MSVNFATFISKEDFKRALGECFKKAWVWHNAENFKAMLEWQRTQQLVYYDKEKINDESDFQHDGVAIDLIKVYQEASSAQQTVFLRQFEHPEGFSYEHFPGETLADGFAVGEKARILFTLRGSREQPQQLILDLKDLSYNEALTQTKKLLSSNAHRYSYGFELAFAYDDQHLKVRPDVLRFKGNRHLDIIEIKATSKAKPSHFFDLAYQIYVLEKNGWVVDQAYLGHLNPDFIWGLNLAGVNLSEAANQIYKDTPKITYEQAWLAFSQVELPPNEPHIEIDESLEDLFVINPEYKKSRSKESITYIEAYRQLNQDNYLDDLFRRLAKQFSMSSSTIQPYLANDYCRFKHQYKMTEQFKGWQQVEPEPFCYHTMPWFDLNKESIFNLTGAANFTNHHKAMIYRQTNLVYFEEIKSLEWLETRLPNLNKPLFLEPHYRHFGVYKEYCSQPEKFHETSMLHQPLDALKENLGHYQQYPLFMYDFETAKWAIPRFSKTKTYQQIPFQFSIDVLINETYNYRQPQTMRHHDFLATERDDPRPNFIHEFLVVALGYGPGKYVAYNDAFEKTVLKHLAFLFPHYRIPLLYVVQNTIDLMTFFKGKKNHWPWFEVYHPDFHGSYSIKKTQPALDPNFSYNDLSINRGDQASQTFREFIDGYLPLPLWREKIYHDLLSYCNRDTLAMVVILQRIREIYAQGAHEYATI